MNEGALVLMVSGAITGAWLGHFAGTTCAVIFAVIGAAVGYVAWALCQVSAASDEAAKRLHE